MIELGRVQELMVVREKNFGVYLGQKKDDAAAVLLPKKQVPEGTKVGDKLKVFIYKDSEDRLIATTSMPKLELGGTAVLKVKDVSKKKICCSRLKSRYIRFAPGKSAW